ncbi:MAG: ABC transporter ATP-binding protein/permease [Bacteroidales bacterium]|nr:ABC transporter ATP-binding protein/permease [Bacteroidales bacterium]
MNRLTSILVKEKAGMVSAFILTSAVAALFTMGSALSVTDFLQLIFPSDSSASMLKGASNPLMRLLDKVYVVLAAQGTTKALVLYALLLLVLYGMKNLFSYLSAVAFSNVKTSVLRSLRNLLHRSATNQDFASWSSQRQGQWLSAMSNDVVEYEANVLDSLRMIVSSSLTMIIYVIMLLYLDWKLTLLVVFVMLVGTLLLSASRRLKRRSRQLQALNGELLSTTQETIDSLKEIKAATAIEYVNHRQREQNSLFTKRRISLYRQIYAASPLSDFVGNTIVVVILIIGAYRVLGDSATLSASLFVSYIMIYVLLLTPIKDFSNAIAQLKKGRGVEDRLHEMTSAAKGQESTPGGGVENKEVIDSITFKDVSFGYGENDVISHLDLELPMHCHIAVTGESGSGKSTFGRLLSGLMEPRSGAILINGHASSAMERASLIAYIPQEPMLFNDTIEENIRFGREWISQDDIAEAVRVAQVSSIVDNLPNGLQSIIGDGGCLLSGGERQRISIARALAGKPEVVVMDEATAALDAATESQFTLSLRQMLLNHTVVIIAHRASTIASCDKIFDVKSHLLKTIV